MSALFTPIKLRGLNLANRIMVAPMCQYSSVNGEANDWHFTHINSLALSGAAIFCIEATAVEATGRITPGCLGLYNDATEAALKPILASVRKRSKATVMIQLAHAGRKASSHTPWDGGQLIPVAEGGLVDAAAAGERIAAECVRRHEPLKSRPRRRRWRRPGRRRSAGGIQRHRSALRPRLSPASVPVANRKSAHRSIWRQLAGKSHALSARSVRRGARCVSARQAGRIARVLLRLGRGRLGPGADDRICPRIERPWRRLDRRVLGRRVAVAETPLGPGYQVPFAQAIREATGLTTIAVGLITEAEAGRGDRRLRQGRHGRARARHAFRPALGLACGGRTRRRSLRPAAILALAALDAEGAVRRDDVRDEVAPTPSLRRANFCPSDLSYLGHAPRVLCSRLRATDALSKNEQREDTLWRSDISRCRPIRRSAD